MAFLNGPGGPIDTGTGFRDQTVNATGAGAGASAPSFTNYGGNLSFWRGQRFVNNQTDELHLLFHPNHDYKPGTPINFHVHWTPTSSASGNVKFGFEYSFARGYGIDAFPASQTVYVVQAAAGAANVHQIAEAADTFVTNYETDGILLVRFFRPSTDPQDTYGDDVNVLTIDVHYQTDRFCTTMKNRINGWDP